MSCNSIKLTQCYKNIKMISLFQKLLVNSSSRKRGISSVYHNKSEVNHHRSNRNDSNGLCRHIHTSQINCQIKPQPDSGVNIFDRTAKVLQRERAAKSEDVELFDYIKEEIGWRLADRVFDVKRTFKNAVDLGCSRGYVCRHLTPESVEAVTLCDTNQSNLDQAQLPEGIQINKIVMDEENIQFPPNSLDLVISSLSLHWVNDLPGCFDKIMSSLKKDGVFIATLFGEDTLFELRSSLQLADLERNGGIAPHISPFTRIRDIGGLLNRSGFALQTIDTDELVIGYPTMFELMWDLKGMAENNSAHNRQMHLSRNTQMAAAAIYNEMYGKTDPETNLRSIPATFQIIYLMGWKPDKSQPKPIARGSGQVSLKDLHRLDEIVERSGKIQLDPEDEPKK